MIILHIFIECTHNKQLRSWRWTRLWGWGLWKRRTIKNWTLLNPKSINKMINLLLKMMFRNIFLHMVKYIPWMQEIVYIDEVVYIEVVYIEPCSIGFIPDHFKTQKMCNKAVCMDPWLLKYVPVHLRMHEMYERGGCWKISTPHERCSWST